MNASVALWSDTDRRKPRHLERNLSQYNSYSRITHTDRFQIELGPLR